MRISFAIGVLFFVSLTSCSSVKRNINNNTIANICDCTNSKGQNFNEKLISTKKDLNLSSKEFEKHLYTQFITPDSWIIKDFLKDEVFLENFKKHSATFQKIEKDEWEKMKEENPACFSFLSLSPMLVGQSED
ncbi:MAG: hypothetical protein MRY78_06300 [Saprospiraceae bacterium]|nr:hypothetical protein [Saprospiraceae bacterium]